MEPNLKGVWTATILVLSLCIGRCNGQQCNAGDSKALLEFKAGFTDPGNLFISWQQGTNCCTWSMVNCTSSGRVQGLQILAPFPTRGPTPRRNPSYNGAVGATVGDLSELVSLQLDSISFDGPMPNTFNKLKKLEDLQLVFNNFSGSVSPSIGGATSLKTMRVDLYGPFPVVGLVPAPVPLSLCNLVKLQSMEINFGMTGNIPACFCRFNQLTTYDLSGNNLGGEIPNCIGYNQPKLTSFVVSFNKLTGPIPATLSRLSKLEELQLDNNKLSGSIPAQIGNLVNLVYLSLNNNSLSGPMPASLGRLTNLGFLDLSTNYLTRVTPELGKLVKLTNLLLNSNKLQGSLPQAIATAGSQGDGLFFNVSDNILSGAIPNLCSSGKYFSFYASKNFFSGGFPLFLASCTYVDLSSNFLWDSRQVGTLPASSPLAELYLANNRFSGPIPSWFNSLIAFTSQTIQILDISANKFTGTFPPSLFSLPNLSKLNGSYNMFNGQLPTNSFTAAPSSTLDLGHNRFYGPIPSTFFAGLIDATYLDLSFNSLSGPLPANSGDFSRLQYLDLSDNGLTGTVPASVENIPSLEYLDLSNNMFTGNVPSKRPPPGTQF
ncbi:hypothetical protein MPTK1_5g09910 [Marchantia polymorpha subsp. ruderalis]|nr:hypothetical protein MARPO_0048s0080 [Marchantia polymorpha]BBN11198.1 hypothetical protein Mp_5g09910 [Marchantia polymorpha subsp. ruderalis]|eukprot:PTQ38971.1 hypothetical protein MARPO_0048s0080 [Marchantia polymorpha]